MERQALEQEWQRRNSQVIECRKALHGAQLAARETGALYATPAIIDATRELSAAEHNWAAVAATLVALTGAPYVRLAYYVVEGGAISRVEAVYGPFTAMLKDEIVSTLGQRGDAVMRLDS